MNEFKWICKNCDCMNDVKVFTCDGCGRDIEPAEHFRQFVLFKNRAKAPAPIAASKPTPDVLRVSLGNMDRLITTIHIIQGLDKVEPMLIQGGKDQRTSWKMIERTLGIAFVPKDVKLK